MLGQHDILMIGWNPGADEVKAGRPFVGPTGKLLRSWLKRVGILERVGYANACLYRPAEGNRKPSPKEIAGCAPVLTKLISTMKPRLIICVGDPAARMFGFKGSVGQMMGKFKLHQSDWGPTLVTVTYHAAYALRLKGSKKFAEVEAQTLEVIEEALHRISGEREVEDYPRVTVPAVVLFRGGVYAIDTETSDGTDARTNTLDLVQAYRGEGRVTMGPSLLVGPNQPLVFHNAIYDLCVLARHGSLLEHVVGDSMIAAWLLGRQNLSLKGLAWRELGASVIDYEEAKAAGGDVWENYCAQDPVLTWRVHTKLRDEIGLRGLAWLYDNIEMPLQPLLAEMSLKGLEVDHEKVMQGWATMDRRLEVLTDRLADLCGSDFKPNSPAQVKAYLHGQGYRVPDTGVDTLSAIPNPPLFIQYLLSYRKAQKRIGTYYIPLSQLRTISGMWRPCGTDTGRLAQADKNLMNFPADIKGCLRAPEGYVFVYRDYNQAEVRIAAALSGDEYLLGALREGRNIHDELCRAVYGYRAPEQYTASKSSNFARLYGAGTETRSEALGVPEWRLRQLETPWPGFDAWALSQRRLAHTTGEVRTTFGRLLLVNADDNGERQAINFPEQGGVADIVKYAMVLARPAIQQLGGRVVHQEHDSILVQVPEQCAAAADEALGSAMTSAVPQELRDIIPFPSKSVISTHWG